MDPRLLRAYNRELEHLRETGAEFAEGFPKIAGRLGLDGIDCADPYVERLLEGFAFMAARVQVKMDSEYSQFTQHLFETVYPDYLAPTPSMATVCFEADLTEGSLLNGVRIPRGTALEATGSSSTRCTFTTAHDVTLWPFEITEARYHVRDLASLGISSTRGARAAIRLRLRATVGQAFNAMSLDDLELHLRGVGGDAAKIYEQVLAHGIAAGARAPGGSLDAARMRPADSISQVGFEDSEALLPFRSPSFQGYRLLQEYFCHPERFMYFRLTGLGEMLAEIEDREADVIILLDEADEDLENTLSAENFVPFCAPCINLFEKRLDRIQISDRFAELHVPTDRLAPLDYEIHTVASVTGFASSGGDAEQEYAPFFRVRDAQEGSPGCYYSLSRVPRTLTERERKGIRRSMNYTGSEIYISIVDENNAPYRAELRQLGITALCTNRDLPIQIPLGQGSSDFTMSLSAPVKSIRCLGRPSDPLASRADGDFAWRLISHLSTNYYSILDTAGGPAAAALKEILDLYADSGRAELRQQIGGVLHVDAEPTVERLVSVGPPAFIRGLAITVEFDESAFEGSSIFLLGSVLERFFAKYIAINSFTQLIIKSVQRGEVMRWKARIGQRHEL